MNDAITLRALALIEGTDDPDGLRKIAANARRQGNEVVARAAKLRLYSVLPSEEPGTLEYDVWQSIFALEGTLSEERDKTIRLSRTRQKISRDLEQQTVEDLVLGKQSEGFDLLVERDMGELTFEALALRHPDRFEAAILDAAKSRLSAAGLDEQGKK
ncbi:hypothetical protein [Sphingomonas sp. NIBR02145]|uniref:hypothetical protein n=1 Tax=Sphingomonas sp. NIBR02145 TaxID=3014784 RepID=UPI0022B41D96|nr:hypothetical protein [Sphingomonas sp. NIBR02145]WHU01195.1 hypothetical protein O3305_13355 [Sphingomonas sp. NIBR02145]